MSSPVITITEGIKVKKQNKMKIGFGVCCKVHVCRVVENHRGGKNKQDEERGGGMCTGFVGEEEAPITIIKWAEERDKFFFARVFKFERGG